MTVWLGNPLRPLRSLSNILVKVSEGRQSTLEQVTCADTIVGDAKVRGISGDEEKRLSIACELIASLSVIFADEPTIGIFSHYHTILFT